jgi:hypothetical protein
MIRFLLIFVLFLPVQQASAGGLMKALAKEIAEDHAKKEAKKEAKKKAVREAAEASARQSAKTTGRRGATATVRKALVTPGTIAGGVGIVAVLATVGLSANESDVEQEDVNREISTAIDRGQSHYQAKACLHPVKGDYYTVPDWTKICSNGSPPLVSSRYSIDLAPYRGA